MIFLEFPCKNRKKSVFLKEGGLFCILLCTSCKTLIGSHRQEIVKCARGDGIFS